MNSDENEQPRLATVQVTNEAWTDEIQRLIGLLEREFYVDAEMADGKLHVIRKPRSSNSSSESRESEPMSLDERHEYVDELLDRMREAVRDAAEGNTVSDAEELRERIETLRQSDRDIADGRTSTLDEVREELDGDGSDDAEESEQSEQSETSQEPTEDESEDQSDESLTKREKRMRRLRENMEDGEPYTSTELAAIAYDQDEDDVTASAKAYVSGLRSELGIETMDDPRRDGNAKLYYRGARPDVTEDQTEDDTDDETEKDASETVPCPHCGDEYAPKGLGPHRRSCPENPDNQDATDTDQYRCGNCGEGFPTERGVKNHQNRGRDCTGADIERVEQTDDSETAASAADPSGDDADDADLDPGVGAVPIDPDTVDETVVEDDDEPVPADAPDEDDKDRVRREPSTVREVFDAAVPGTYLCVDCGFILGADEDAAAVRHHDFRRHDPYIDEDGDEYRQLADVPDDELAERWLLTYKNVGSTWTHPRLHEARKNGIVTVLEEADYFLDVAEIRERLNELLQASAKGHYDRKLCREQLVEDPGYLDELVDEGRVEKDGKTYGVDAERAAELVEATA